MKVVAVDQGTTGTKSYVYDDAGRFASVASFEHAQFYPQPGYVEHNPEELLRHVSEAIAAAGKVDAIGIDNQGETVIAWDAATGRPIHNAIVWQDDRTKHVTERLKAEGAEEVTQAIAGLPLDPYFSAAKLRWFIDHVPEAKELLRQKRLRLGTSEAFFLARLTGQFVTDVTNASRTSLMSLETFAVGREALRSLRRADGMPAGDQALDRALRRTPGRSRRPRASSTSRRRYSAMAAPMWATSRSPSAPAPSRSPSRVPERVNGSRFGIVPTVAWQQKGERRTSRWKAASTTRPRR